MRTGTVYDLVKLIALRRSADVAATVRAAGPGGPASAEAVIGQTR
ncbi:MAG TPA: hypothetical protein VF163_07555 [Micromonosporaceae bacterium]